MSPEPISLPQSQRTLGDEIKDKDPMRSCIVSQAISTKDEGDNNEADEADIKDDDRHNNDNDDDGGVSRITAVDDETRRNVVKMSVAVAT